VDVFLQRRRDGRAAKRFFKCLLRASGSEPRRIVTDKLRSYGVAHRELIPDTIHDTSQYANNQAELSHQPTRVRERGMRRFKFTHQAQRFLSTHTAVYNLFNLGRHLISARHYRFFRARSLPLGCSAPLRLGIAQRPHNRINIGSLVVLGHRFVNTRWTTESVWTWATTSSRISG